MEWKTNVYTSESRDVSYVLALEMLPGYEALVSVSMGPCGWLCM